jgi:hypothetical protein
MTRERNQSNQAASAGFLRVNNDTGFTIRGGIGIKKGDSVTDGRITIIGERLMVHHSCAKQPSDAIT